MALTFVVIFLIILEKTEVNSQRKFTLPPEYIKRIRN